jgi:tRNA U34 2-thiouridine synthase MnmA/TrmU
MDLKALALLSGGLDSTLAVKLVQQQGISVDALNFTSPFCLCKKGGCGAIDATRQLGIRLQVMDVGEDYLKMLRAPKHGYGKNMNPCIDCRIFMLRRAREHAQRIGAAFIFTGEVLNERPMSQTRASLQVIEREAGLEGKVLRPLSAKLLPETEAERNGWVDRQKLLALTGRSRKPQIALARRLDIANYPCPAGGCLLTHKEFAAKLRDLFEHEKTVQIEDINRLKVGRHFRFKENKIIVGRSEAENKQLHRLKDKRDYVFEVPNCGSPITLLRGPKTQEAIKKAAALTLRYSDSEREEALVRFGDQEMNRSVVVSPAGQMEIERLRIQRHCHSNPG